MRTAPVLVTAAALLLTVTPSSSAALPEVPAGSLGQVAGSATGSAGNTFGPGPATFDGSGSLRYVALGDSYAAAGRVAPGAVAAGPAAVRAHGGCLPVDGGRRSRRGPVHHGRVRGRSRRRSLLAGPLWDPAAVRRSDPGYRPRHPFDRRERRRLRSRDRRVSGPSGRDVTGARERGRLTHRLPRRGLGHLRGRPSRSDGRTSPCGSPVPLPSTPPPPGTRTSRTWWSPPSAKAQTEVIDATVSPVGGCAVAVVAFSM